MCLYAIAIFHWNKKIPHFAAIGYVKCCHDDSLWNNHYHYIATTPQCHNDNTATKPANTN